MQFRGSPPNARPSEGEGPASGRWSAEVSRTVREALETVATPEVAGRLLFEALREARLSALPDGHDDLRAFVESELSPVIVDALGPDAATLVTQRIDTMLRVLARIQPGRPDTGRQATGEDPARRERAISRTPVATQGAVHGAGTSIPRDPPSAPVDIAKIQPAQRETRRPARGDATVQLVQDRETLTGPPSAVSGVPGSGVSGAGRVVLVTTDARLGSELRVRIGAGATVLTYRTPAELARSPVGAVHVLVLDVRDLSRDFELTTRARSVLLWPSDVEARDRFAARHPSLGEVRFAGDDAGIEDLASVVLLSLATPI